MFLKAFKVIQKQKSVKLSQSGRIYGDPTFGEIQGTWSQEQILDKNEGQRMGFGDYRESVLVVHCAKRE